jgi:pimeloyl-ACP methyl ester carboxylesterase
VIELLGDGSHLVGHSFGACVALAAAARAPSRIRSLTMIEPGMQALAMDIPAVRQLGIRMLAAKYLTVSDAARARKFSDLVGIPPEVRGNRTDAELRAMGRGAKTLRIPSRRQLEEQLSIVRASPIPLLVVSGGWSAAFEAVCERVAKLGGGRHIVIPTPHHFPNFQRESFNGELERFVRDADSKPAAAS